ncbi:MAG: Gfo/Idh/MocA family oxidoreductase [Armatimonadetes bacterium]|nr:Gfo/Idh/MocA family oxidoreductase [Armatimonadota bacterium]
MSKKLSRRDLLKASAIAGVGMTIGLPASVVAGTTTYRVQSRLPRFAVVGVAGKGASDMASANTYGKLVSLCDADVGRLTTALIQHPECSAFNDYRMMLEKMDKEIDAVVISTPDHNHAPAAALAMRMGKHVFVQKPLTRTLHEARMLQRIAKDNRVMSQMGNQGTASTDLRKVAKMLEDKMFGDVKEVHVWTDRASGWWPQGVGRPDVKPIPRTLNWEMWLGPAPFRVYADGYHPFAWRGRWDFGSGSLGDMGCHVINLAFMGLDLRDPTSVQAETSGNNRETYPVWSKVKYEFPERRGRAALTMYWYDGGKKPDPELTPGITTGGNGSIFVCENATLYTPDTYGSGTVIVGGGDLPEVEVEESPGHFKELVDAINDGKRAKSDIVDYSGPLTETVLLGNLAIWADGEKVEWDSRRTRVRNSDEFNDLITPTYRDGWKL